jgi:DNA-binding transcriptional LysR family regulator
MFYHAPELPDKLEIFERKKTRYHLVIRKDYPDAKITISSNNLTAHKELVLQGLGVAILSDLYANQDIRFQMKFVKRKTTILSSAAAELVSSCLQF